MNKFLLFLLLVGAVFCENNETFNQDDFKCSLPEVETIDGNLDISRFRSDFSKISEMVDLSRFFVNVHTKRGILSSHLLSIILRPRLYLHVLFMDRNINNILTFQTNDKQESRRIHSTSFLTALL